jgi:hypothetical protein
LEFRGRDLGRRNERYGDASAAAVADSLAGFDRRSRFSL